MRALDTNALRPRPGTALVAAISTRNNRFDALNVGALALKKSTKKPCKWTIKKSETITRVEASCGFRFCFPTKAFNLEIPRRCVQCKKKVEVKNGNG